MKLSKKQLVKLNKEYEKLEKDEKIISINEVKEKIDYIIDLTEDLEELLVEQLSEIELFDECDDEECGCGVEQTELYDLYDSLYECVVSNNGNMYKAFRIIS